MSSKGQGPFGRYAPGHSWATFLPELTSGQKASIEAIFDVDFRESDWRRMQDAMWNMQRHTEGRIGLLEWKARNTAQKDRLKLGLEHDDQQIAELAWSLQSHRASTLFDCLTLMNKEILADEQTARAAKKAGSLYDRDLNGDPVHDFCWVEAIHVQTEALISFFDILSGLGASTEYRNPRSLLRNKDQLEPTPFEEFCFRYIFDFEYKSGDSGGERFLSYLQRINSALEQGRKWKLIAKKLP